MATGTVAGSVSRAKKSRSKESAKTAVSSVP